MSMLNTTLFLIAGSVLAASHALSISLYLYWRYWWLDLPMHALGGATVALLVYVLADLRIVPRSWTSLKGILTIVCVVAIGWECFEILAGVPLEDDYVVDTVTDLIMGIGGAGVATYVARKLSVLS